MKSASYSALYAIILIIISYTENAELFVDGAGWMDGRVYITVYKLVCFTLSKYLSCMIKSNMVNTMMTSCSVCRFGFRPGNYCCINQWN